MKLPHYILVLAIAMLTLAACEKITIPSDEEIKQETGGTTPTGGTAQGGTPQAPDSGEDDPPTDPETPTDDPPIQGDGFYHGYATISQYLDHFGNDADHPLPFSDLLEGGCMWHDIVEADAYTGIESISACWVRGYIVGSVGGTTMGSIHWALDNPVETSIVLAQSADCTDPSFCVPIQLAKGSSYIDARQHLNLLQNPDMLGAHVAVRGKLTKYMRVVGIKNTSKYVVLDDNP